ncbi:hypothetical protein ACFWWN_16070, partial [Streptomyces sp. NPDC059082]
ARSSAGAGVVGRARARLVAVSARPSEPPAPPPPDLLLGRLLRPRLSTVRIDMVVGRELAELVDRAVREPETAPLARDLLDSRVLRRESS